MGRCIGWQLVIELGHEAISHLKHLVHEFRDVTRPSVSDTNQQIGTIDAQHEKIFAVLILLIIHFGDFFKHLSEAVIHLAIGFCFKVFISNKDLIVRVDILDTVRQFFLSLGGQEANYVYVDFATELVCVITSPGIIILHEGH